MTIYPTPRTLIVDLHSRGMSYAQIADTLDICRSTVCLLRHGGRSNIVYDSYMKLYHLHKLVCEGTMPDKVKRVSVSICSNKRDHEVVVKYADHPSC